MLPTEKQKKLFVSRHLLQKFTVLSKTILLLHLTACSPTANSIAPEADKEYISVTNVPIANQELTGNDSLAPLKSISPFPIGTAFNSAIIKNSAKARGLFYSQFNAKTVHAYMNVEPVQGQFNFGEIDYWVNTTQAEPIRLHGHCLVYHIAAPEWLLSFQGTTGEFEEIVKKHIQTIVSRYRDKVKSWDVINEVFDYNSGTIRQTVFRKIYSNDAAYLAFVKKCFLWAHEADPNAYLFYNDFNLESSEQKLNAVIQFVNDCKKSGVPIDGVGTQMHITINTPELSIRNSLQRLSSTGLLVHISELDVCVNPSNEPGMAFTKSIHDAQAAKYYNVSTLYRRNVPTPLQYGITMWSFSDADSWIVSDKKQHDMPTVLDASYDKKAAFFGLLRGLKY